MPQLGLSFQPGMLKPGQQDGQPGGGAPGGVSPVQEAIQLLSFRLPTQAQGIAPMSLLMGRGGAGVPGAVSGTPTAAQLARLRAMLGLDPGVGSGESGSSAMADPKVSIPSAVRSISSRPEPLVRVGGTSSDPLPGEGDPFPEHGSWNPASGWQDIRPSARREDKYAGMYAPERLEPSL